MSNPVIVFIPANPDGGGQNLFAIAPEGMDAFKARCLADDLIDQVKEGKAFNDSFFDEAAVADELSQLLVRKGFVIPEDCETAYWDTE